MPTEPLIDSTGDASLTWEQQRDSLLSPPHGWPSCFEQPPLRPFISDTLAGKRVRACAPLSASNAAKLGGVALSHDSHATALLVRLRTGWEVLAGYAVFERQGGAFVARRFWWNAKKNGAWVDATPRAAAHGGEMVLVESDQVPLPPPLAEGEKKREKKAALDGQEGGEARCCPLVGLRGGAAERSGVRHAQVDPMRQLYVQQHKEAEEYSNKLSRQAKMKGLSKAERKAVREAELAAAQAQAEAMAANERAMRERAEAAEQAVIEAAHKAAAEKAAREEAKKAAEKAKRDAAVEEARRTAKRAEEGSRLAAAALESQGAEACWDLAKHLALISPFKDAGGKFFALGLHEEALEQYHKGVAAAASAASLAWPAVESAAIACRANAALCLLKLGRPKEAEAEVDAALRLPMGHASGPTMLAKLYLRKLQAMIDQAEDPLATDDRYDETVELLDCIRRRGLSDAGSAGAKSFAEQEKRMNPPPRPPPPVDPEAEKLEAVLQITLHAFSTDRSPSATPLDALATDLGTVLETDSMAPRSALAEDKQGRSILWALAYGLQTNPTDATRDFFCQALPYLMDSWRANGKVPVDNRLPDLEKPASCTALMYAARSASLAAVEALLARGACVNLRDARGTTALIYACTPSATAAPADVRAVIRRLIAARADVNAQDLAGQSALMYAASKLDPRVVQLLLDAGADAAARDAKGQSCALLLALPAKPEQEEERKACLDLILAPSGPLRKEQELEMRAQQFFGQLLQQTLVPLANEFAGASRGLKSLLKAKQEVALVQAVMKYFALDEAKLTQPAGPYSNFYEALHKKLLGLLPPPFLKVYQDAPPESELALIMTQCLDAAKRADEKAAKIAKENGGVRTAAFDAGTYRDLALVPYRRRGKVARCMHDFQNLIVLPLRRVISHAVPSTAALKAIAKVAPIVEMGAGSGYWAAMLQERGVDVVAFDAEPPEEGKANNEFATRQFTAVRRGDSSVFSDSAFAGERLHERALLLVWPNQDPTEEDDPTQDPWELECLQESTRAILMNTRDYYAAGGETVIYVGERTECVETILGAPVDPGTTASKRFQVMLHAKYSMVDQANIPNLLYALDDCSIWKRK
ncbi:hypothetical protein AB1Y20_006511 [Prymnesium parvum]|uniref:Uncharacterized protein n=1 Tax=Prymnesium parvum TaxID=97485 RepID=A0AB34IZ12_PRYPA